MWPTEKKVMGVDVENKVTRKHMKRLRKKLNRESNKANERIRRY